MTDPLAALFALDQFGIKFGLENIRAIVAALGHPERGFHAVHIAGTNGKGSVAAMVDAALRSSGHRTGRYTSPHLVDITERFTIDGTPVRRTALAAVVADVQQVIAELINQSSLFAQPTFFEVTTAAAFELFKRAGIEIAVCEVGLGGRLDSTNVLTPLVTAITSIDFDHQKYLGTTLAEIAAEKAGIIKPGVPAILGAIEGEARMVIERIAAERQAPIVRATPIAATPARPALSPHRGLSFHLQTPDHDYGVVTLGLPGAHQMANAMVAVRLLEALDARGISVSADAVVDGLSNVSWPGRLDLRCLPDGREILLDAAHNPSGAAALAEFLGSSGWSGLPIVFAAMRDKDTDGMLEALLPIAGSLIVTRASNARSEDPDELASVVRRLAPHMRCEVIESVGTALDAAWQRSARIVAAGSIFLLGDILKELQQA